MWPGFASSTITAMQLSAGFTPHSRGGVCSICVSEAQVSPQRGVILTDIEIDYEGQFDICVTCILQAASLVGATSPEDTAHMDAELETLRCYADEVYAELHNRDQTISALSSALSRLSGERDDLAARLEA